MIIVFDVETTGKYDHKAHPRAERQPHIVSLALLAFSDDGKHEVGQYYAIVRPNGYVIPPGATHVHGISHDFAEANGIPCGSVLLSFLTWYQLADLAIAYNKEFDNAMIARDLLHWLPNQAHLFDPIKTRCAMLAASACMKRPNLFGYEGYAWPKLADAYEWCFKIKMEGAHNSMADARATAHLMFALQDLNYWSIKDDRAFV